MHSEAGMPDTILSCNVIATCGCSSHNCVTQKINKQVKAKKLSWIRDQRAKKQGNNGITTDESRNKGGPL